MWQKERRKIPERSPWEQIAELTLRNFGAKNGPPTKVRDEAEPLPRQQLDQTIMTRTHAKERPTDRRGRRFNLHISIPRAGAVKRLG